MDWERRFAELSEGLLSLPPPTRYFASLLGSKTIYRILAFLDVEDEEDRATLISCTFVSEDFQNCAWSHLYNRCKVELESFKSQKSKEVVKALEPQPVTEAEADKQDDGKPIITPIDKFISFVVSSAHAAQYIHQLRICPKAGHRKAHLLEEQLTYLLDRLPHLRVLLLDDLWLGISHTMLPRSTGVATALAKLGEDEDEEEDGVPRDLTPLDKAELNKLIRYPITLNRRNLPLRRLHLRNCHFIHLIVTRSLRSLRLFDIFDRIDELQITYPGSFILNFRGWPGDRWKELARHKGKIIPRRPALPFPPFPTYRFCTEELNTFKMASHLVLSQSHNVVDFNCHDWDWLITLNSFLRDHGTQLSSLRVGLMGALPFYNAKEPLVPPLSFPVEKPYILDLSSCTKLEFLELKLQVQSFYGNCEDYFFYTRYLSDVIQTLPIPQNASITPSLSKFVMRIDFVDLKIHDIKNNINLAFNWPYLNHAFENRGAFHELNLKLRLVKRNGRKVEEVEVLDDPELLNIFTKNLPTLMAWDCNVFT
ncbi:hypothetical protein ABKN59_011755 [Abortiporus biennis]